MGGVYMCVCLYICTGVLVKYQSRPIDKSQRFMIEIKI